MRYKEYNINRVLEKVIPIFWSNGFGGCSIKDIVEEVGVNRFSLYHEFGNKEGILYSSLQLFRERYGEPKFEILKQNGKPKEILHAFFLSFLNSQEDQQGCYFIHIGTELADSDSEIKELVKGYLEDIERLFENLLERHGYIKSEAAFSARHLIGLYCTSMSFCLIHTEQQKLYHISNGISVILNKNQHATSIK